ncbi:hypothetical protein BHM03_00013549 [Ensete ventricosum]|nr:hypothetical protein BHM03_00013549 [Ensete ventricosum]
MLRHIGTSDLRPYKRGARECSRSRTRPRPTSQHIDTVDCKKRPSLALPPQHIDTVVALPLLPIAIAARYFSIPESCGVPHLFAASVTLHRRLLPLLLHLHEQSLPLCQSTTHHHPVASFIRHLLASNSFRDRFSPGAFSQ